MSELDPQQTSDVGEGTQKATDAPTEYAPMPLFLPLMFLIVFGLIVAYGVVSK